MTDRRRQLRLLGLALLFGGVLAVQSGCWNGVHDSNIFEGGGLNRFTLVIEPNRTDIDGTHYLVDSLTGDVWRLDAAQGTSFDWVRLVSGPEDAAEIPTPGEEKEKEN